jgi:hypothetical protein
VDSVREIESAQAVVRSPTILNGTGFGPMANHSTIMAAGGIDRRSDRWLAIRTADPGKQRRGRPQDYR